MEAYALYVRYLQGDADPVRARRLFAEANLPVEGVSGGLSNPGPGRRAAPLTEPGLSLEALGWLLPVLKAGGADTEVQAVLQHLRNRVEETASGVQFTTAYAEGEYLVLHTSRRTDAVILDALIQVDPTSDLVPKLVTSLLDQRSGGRWNSTQENVFVLLALERYFRTFEMDEPNLVARAWVGAAFGGEHRFKGRSTDSAHLRVPMSTLVATPGRQSVAMTREGTGRLYYRVGLTYAPQELKLAAVDNGFTVERRYEALDDANDVHQAEDGVWHVRAGSRVRVKITLVAPARRYHVALVDPMPAGFEALNPELAVTGTIPAEAEARLGPWWWWLSPWYEHQELGDDRAEAFTSMLWAGVHTFSYVARATTPGTFVVPPARAEEMYHPETFGRGDTEWVAVE